MIVALVSTKLPILLGEDSGSSTCRRWRATASGACCTRRADLDMPLGALYLVFEGAGAWTIDARIAGDRTA
jgi:hypothetical protein